MSLASRAIPVVGGTRVGKREPGCDMPNGENRGLSALVTRTRNKEGRYEKSYKFVEAQKSSQQGTLIARETTTFQTILRRSWAARQAAGVGKNNSRPKKRGSINSVRVQEYQDGD